MAAISVGVCPDAPSSSTGQEVTIPGPGAAPQAAGCAPPGGDRVRWCAAEWGLLRLLVTRLLGNIHRPTGGPHGANLVWSGLARQRLVDRLRIKASERLSPIRMSGSDRTPMLMSSCTASGLRDTFFTVTPRPFAIDTPSLDGMDLTRRCCKQRLVLVPLMLILP